jgi:hypothetical protein
MEERWGEGGEKEKGGGHTLGQMTKKEGMEKKRRRDRRKRSL